MNKKTKSFPLPLSSVRPDPTEKFGFADDKSRQSGIRGGAGSAQKIATGRATMPMDPLEMLPAKKAGDSGFKRAMVERLSRAGIKDSVVLKAIGEVPRHLFVEPGLSGQAYEDVALPIGAHQTISKPSTVAKMLEVLHMSGNQARLKKVLEIGTGCGYEAAVLARMADEVYSIERIKSLHELARRNLRTMRIANLRLHYGDGMLGLPQAAPFDGIIIAAAGLDVPEELLTQLAVGGRLVAPVGGEQQTLQLIRRVSKSKWERSILEDCYFVALKEGTV